MCNVIFIQIKICIQLVHISLSFFFLFDILKYYFQDQMIKQNSRQTLKYNVRHQTAALVFLVKWVWTLIPFISF